MKTTVIVGDLNVDVVLPKMERMPSPGEELFFDRFALKAGGSAANTAITLARAGCPARLFARVGTDGGAAFLVEELRSSGVDISFVRMDPAASTGITVSLPFPGTAERAYLTYPGSLSESGIGDIFVDATGDRERKESGWSIPGGHLHLASFFIQEKLRNDVGPLLKDPKRDGMTTSLDPGRTAVKQPENASIVGRAEPWDLSPLSPYFEYLDWFMPNGGELGGITGTADAGRALETLSTYLNGVVVKLGAEGALIRHGGTVKAVPAPVAYPLDTTCAGDCFDAGFLCGLSMGLPIEKTAELGNRFGALAVSCLGLPEIENIRSLLRELGYGAHSS
jgi:sugar/nucleoside kinase (ribokinase family)